MAGRETQPFAFYYDFKHIKQGIHPASQWLHFCNVCLNCKPKVALSGIFNRKRCTLLSLRRSGSLFFFSLPIMRL